MWAAVDVFLDVCVDVIADVVDWVIWSLEWLSTSWAGFSPTVSYGTDLVSDSYQDGTSVSSVFGAIHGAVGDIAVFSAVL